MQMWLLRKLLYGLSWGTILVASHPLLAQIGTGPWWSSAQVGAITYSVDRGETRGLPLPCIYMEDGGGLLISFDLLGDDAPVLAYELKYCRANWEPTPLSPAEYLGGGDGVELSPPIHSTKTLFSYCSYSLRLPNEYTTFALSGNYLLRVYPISDPSETILTIPIGVVSREVGVSLSLTAPLVRETSSHQQIEVKVKKSGGAFSINWERDLYILVVQNGRWDNAHKLDRPTRSTSSEWLFQDTEGAVFEGGNEYHNVEHLSLQGYGRGVERATLTPEGHYLLELSPQSLRSGLPYADIEDRNGAEQLAGHDRREQDDEGEYHWVRFSLRSPKLEGEVVLQGDAFRAIPMERRTCLYDASVGRYKLTLPLKAGYQEYQFLHRLGEGVELSSQTIEGSHYQTSNDYVALVYLRDPIRGIDRLLGFGAYSHR